MSRTSLVINESTYGEQELTRIEIDYGILSEKATPFSEVIRKIQEFLAENCIEKHVKTRRKHIKYMDALLCNKLVLFMFEKFKNDSCVTKVDIFSAITDYLDVRPDEFYAALTDKLKVELQKSLVENVGFDIDFDVDKDKLKKLGYKQVSI